MRKPYKTICADCECEMRVLKNNAKVVTQSGYDTYHEIWNADMRYCPDCGKTVVPANSYALEPSHCIHDEGVTHEEMERYLRNWKKENAITARVAGIV